MKTKKRGQMKLSFGMIFSIILIIIFLAFTFFAIKKFLGIQDNVKISQFRDNLQNDIDKLWKGSQGSQERFYYLPSTIEFVCFVDYSSPSRGPKASLYNRLKQVYYEFENLIFYPIGSGDGTDALIMKHIDIEKITETENPLCIPNDKGKVKMNVEKSYGDASVTISV